MSYEQQLKESLNYSDEVIQNLKIKNEKYQEALYKYLLDNNIQIRPKGGYGTGTVVDNTIYYLRSNLILNHICKLISFKESELNDILRGFFLYEYTKTKEIELIEYFSKKYSVDLDRINQLKDMYYASPLYQSFWHIYREKEYVMNDDMFYDVFEYLKYGNHENYAGFGNNNFLGALLWSLLKNDDSYSLLQTMFPKMFDIFNRRLDTIFGH